MFDNSSDKDRKKQSLLSLGALASGSASRGGGSAPADSATPANDDPSLRHRLARSRREAAQSPLLSALAKMEEARAEPNAPEPNKSRWNLRDLLSQKLRYEQPEPEEPAKPVFAAQPRPPAEAPRQQQPAAARPTVTRPTEPASRSEPEDRADRILSDETFAAAEPSPNDPYWRPLVDPLRVISGVVNSKRLMLATTVAGAMIGAAIAVSTPKKYEAFSELLVDPRDLKVSDRDLTQTGLTSDALVSLVENQVRVLTSGPVLNRVVDELKLEDDPEFNGQSKSFGIGGIVAELRGLLSRGGGGGENDNRRAIAVGTLAGALHVERSGRTFIVTVSAVTQDGEKSALIVNTVNEVFLQTTGELLSDTAGRTADELNARLEELRNGVEAAERNVETFKAENDLIDTQGRLISEDELVKLNDQLSTARARTIELNARAASVRSAEVDSVIGGGFPEELASPVMSELRSQYAAIKREADLLSVRLGPRHPQYLAQQAQLQGAREQIQNELRRIVASVQTELKRAVQLEQDLASRLAQLKVKSGDVNGSLVTLRELEREATAKRAVYENYLLRAKEAGEQRGINTANISVISQAYPPLDPTGPSRATVAMTGAIMGLFAGIALGMARGIFWSVRDKSRARRRSSGASQPPSAFTSAIMSGAPAEFPEGNESRFEKTIASSETATSPLARLIERMRRPAHAGKPEPVQPDTASIPTANSNENPETEMPVRGERANQEAPQMPPYPQQPVYPQPAQAQYPSYPQAPMQPAPYAPYPPAFAQPQYPLMFAPQPVGYPYPAAMQPQPAFHGWQPQPPVMMPYGYPQAPYPTYPSAPQQQPAPYPHEGRPVQAPETRMAPSPRDMSPIEEVRESLREFREAIRDLVEDRARKRYS